MQAKLLEGACSVPPRKRANGVIEWAPRRFLEGRGGGRFDVDIRLDAVGGIEDSFKRLALSALEGISE